MDRRGSEIKNDSKIKLFAYPADFSEHATPACTSLILDEILKIDYKFGINDPSELAGETLSFYKGLFLLSFSTIFVSDDGNVYKLASMR